jgi:hypothetical protein
MLRRPTHACCILAMTLMFWQAPVLRAQAGRSGRSSAFTEIKWDTYTFKFFPGNQMGQALDADGHVVGTILSQGGALQVLPSVTGDAAGKLKKSFQAWKDQGGEKSLSSGSAAAPGASRAPATDAKSSPTTAPAPSAAPTISGPERPTNPATTTPNGVSPGNRVAGVGTPSAAPVSGGPVVGGARLGTLSNPMTAELVHGNLTAFLDMQLLRLQPALLDDPQVLKFFAMMNNCVYNTDDAPTRLNDTAVRKLMRNEFDYPQAADYYRSHGAEILAALPRTTNATIGSAQVGQYDTGRKAFPLVVTRGADSKPATVTLQQRETMRAEAAVTARARGGVSGVCGDAGTQRVIIESKGQVGRNYALDVEKEMTFTQVPMEMDEARKLVDAGWNRMVRFDAELEFLDEPKPAMVKSCANGNSVPCIVFSARVKKITVVKPGSFPPMGKAVPDQALAVVYP